MNPAMIVAAALLASFAITGCSTDAGPEAASGSSAAGASSSGGGGECVIPTARLPLGLLKGADCSADYADTASEATIDGAFKGMSGGFQVVGATSTVAILEAAPAIPEGTFVHVTYHCNPGQYGDSGAYVMIENLATLDGKPNPTEAGTRLWFLAVAGGEIAAPKALPFTVNEDVVCTDKSSPTVIKQAYSITLTGGGGSVTVAPEAEGTLTATSGPAAGKYRVKNVNFTAIGPALPGEGTQVVNFSIDRAD